jgi:hypothetical protein
MKGIIYILEEQNFTFNFIFYLDVKIIVQKFSTNVCEGPPHKCNPLEKSNVGKVLKLLYNNKTNMGHLLSFPLYCKICNLKS